MRSHRCPPPRRRRCISQFPITAIREIKILKILNHKNVVRLKEIVTSKGADYNQGKGSIYMVMEFCDHDLTGLTDAGSTFTVPQIKCYMKQLLEGLAYCHAQKVLHRDIKGSNLLINNEGQLKLADFGLARPYDTDQQRPYTNRVITLWYRPPELLLGATMYGPAIDMWSAGCIFAELLLRKPILPGKNEFEQIDLIFKLLGTPDETNWPGCKSLQYYDMILSQTSRKYQSRFEEKFASLDPTAKDLLRKLLAMDPKIGSARTTPSTTSTFGATRFRLRRTCSPSTRQATSSPPRSGARRRRSNFSSSSSSSRLRSSIPRSTRRRRSLSLIHI